MINQNAQRKIGKNCKKFRENVLKITQKDVAEILGYSVQNISAFECGRNNNNAIFLFYISEGLLNHYSVEELIGWFDYELQR